MEFTIKNVMILTAKDLTSNPKVSYLFCSQSIIVSRYLLDYLLPTHVNPIAVQQHEQQWMSSSLCPVMASSPLKQDPGLSKEAHDTVSCHDHSSDDDIPLSQAEANSFFSEENEIDIDDDDETGDLNLSKNEIENFFNDSFESEDDITLTQPGLSCKQEDCTSDKETEEVTLTQAEIDSFFATEEKIREVEIPELDLPKEEIDCFIKSFFSSDSD